ALKLGAKQVICIDIDPQALEASRDNAERNGVADRLTVYLPKDQPSGLTADVVVANILAGPLKELSPLITALVKPGGQVALSGILDSQAKEVNQLYQQWFTMSPPTLREEWARLNGSKR